MTGEEKKQFCTTGRIVTVECAAVDGTPYYDTGDIATCSVEGGLECLNDINYISGCQDYMIRYQCEQLICGGELKINQITNNVCYYKSPCIFVKYTFFVSPFPKS